MAKSNIDGSVEIAVDMNVDDAERELLRLKKDIIKTENDIQVNIGKRDALTKKLEGYKKRYAELSDYLGSVGSADIGSKEFNKAAAEMEGLEETIKATESAIASTNGSIEKQEAKLVGLKLRYGEIAKEKGPALAFKKVGTAVNSVLSGVGKVATVGGKSFVSLGKGVLAVGGKIASASKSLNVFSKMSKALSGSVKKLGSMIKQAFVFSVVYKGLDMVKNSVASYLNVDKGFTAALANVKGALLTAFQPIYDAVVPALTTLLNVLSQVINTFTQFTSALFGTTAKQAQSNAKALNSQAKATQKSGEAAEEASKSMASFDEINTLQAGGGTGGGGGSAAGAEEARANFDYAFEETPPFATWGEAFDAFLGKISDGIPKLNDVFSRISENINVFSANLLEMFTFPGVEEKVVSIGTQLATALNGLVDKINWNTMGQALGAGIGLAISGLVSFIWTFDWGGLGRSLATLINGIAKEVDWYQFGQLLWSGFKIGIETLAGFILGLDMSELAKSASNLVIGFFDSITETIVSIDWMQIGQQIATFLANIDWAGVATSCFTAIGTAFGAAAAFLWGLIKDAWSSVVTWWEETAFEDGKFTLLGLLRGIGEVISNIGTWIKENIFDPFVNGFKKVFGIHSPSTVMAEQGKFLMEGLLNGVKGMINSVVSVFSGLWDKIKAVFSNVTGWFKDKFSAAWQAVKDVFSKGGTVFLGIKDGILNSLKAVINALITGINRVISIPFNGINNALTRIKGIDILGVKPFEWITTFQIPEIPKLAQGAVIPPNREFMAVLGDQNRGYNIEAPADLIRQIVREEVAASGVNRGGEEIKIVFDGNLAALARVLNPHIEREKTRAGNNMVNLGMGYAR